MAPHAGQHHHHGCRLPALWNWAIASTELAGLALASDAGIALQAASLAVLLHQRRMVSLASLDYAEIGPLPAGCPGGRRGGGAELWLAKRRAAARAARPEPLDRRRGAGGRLRAVAGDCQGSS